MTEFDAVELEMIRRGDMLGPALGEKVFAALQPEAKGEPPADGGLTEAMINELPRYRFDNGNHTWGTDSGSMNECSNGDWLQRERDVLEEAAVEERRRAESAEALLERAMEALAPAFDKVAVWPEHRMKPGAALELGQGFMDLIDLRNAVGLFLAELEARK